MAQAYTDLTTFRDPSLRREALLRILSAGAFLVFFQTYLVAPLIPALAVEFHSSTNLLGMLVPAYMLPYGISTLFYGPLSDRIGRKPVILTLLAMMVVTIAGVATARTVHEMLAWRLLGGIATGGIVPIALALLGDLFPYAERGRPIGWMFGAMAGGMAFGSSVGALLNPIIGWRKEFLITAFLSGITLAFAIRLRHSFESKLPQHPLNASEVISGYINLFSERHFEEGAELRVGILEGAAQIAVPALVSTLCICIVFLPMFFLSGVARYLFVPLAEAVIFAMIASYILSRTLV